jgi:putative MATE family efflux protein
LISRFFTSQQPGGSAARRRPDLVNDPVGQTLFRTTVPTTVGGIAMILYYLADTWFVSLLGTDQLAALGFTFPATIMITYLGVGLGIGTSAMVARAIGARDQNKATEMTLAAIVFGFLLGLLLIIPALLSIDTVFTLMGADSATLVLIRRFISAWYLGIPFLLVQFAGTAVMRASGNASLQGKMMMLGAAINAILDPLLIFGPGPFPAFGIRGAAIATVITWMLCNVFIWYFLAVKEQLLGLIWPGFTKLCRDWHRLLKIALPAALANMITPMATAVITATLAQYGAQAVAGFGVVMRIEALVMIVVLGMSMSLPPFISQNFGAGAMDRVRLGLRLSLQFIVVLQLGLYLIVALAAPLIARIFSPEPEVIAVIVTVLRILPASYAFQGMVVLSASSFNALHAPRNALITSLLRFFIFYVPLALLGAALGDIPGLFVGAALGNLGAGLLITWWIYRYTLSLEPLPGNA